MTSTRPRLVQSATDATVESEPDGIDEPADDETAPILTRRVRGNASNLSLSNALLTFRGFWALFCPWRRQSVFDRVNSHYSGRFAPEWLDLAFCNTGDSGLVGRPFRGRVALGVDETRPERDRGTLCSRCSRQCGKILDESLRGACPESLGTDNVTLTFATSLSDAPVP
jgi:hypothetical protein